MSIVDELREIKEAKEARSERARERYLKGIQSLAEEVKQRKLSKDSPKESLMPEVHMRVLYMSFVEKYYQKKRITMPTSMNNRSKALWKRVVAAHSRCNVSPEQFMRAQFTYFDRNFGCAPKIFQLTTEAAIERANIGGDSTVVPVSGGLDYKLDKSESFRVAEMTLLKVQRAQGISREEVYRKLVIPGHLFIAPAFLKIDPIYSKVVKEGKRRG